MSRVLLVNPPFYRLLGSHYNANSLGIAYIASYLNQHGHDCNLYNSDYQSKSSFTKYSIIHREKGFNSYKSYFEDVNHDIWEEVVENYSV